MMKRLLTKYFGVFLALFAFILFQAFSFFPNFGEAVYRQGIYRAIRNIWSGINSHFFLSADLVFLFVFLVMMLNPFFSRTLFHRPKQNRIINTLGVFIAYFYFIWGFNYACPSFMQHLHIDMESQQIESINIEAQIDRCNKLRQFVNTDQHYGSEPLTETEVAQLSQLVSSVLKQHQFFHYGEASVRQLSSSAWLRKLGIAGIYMPFTGAGNVDLTYLRHQRLFTTAHELAHAYGITDEGEANLIAYIALMQSNNREYQFSATFTLFRYLRYESASDDIVLPQWMIDDLQILKENSTLYPPLFGELSERINDLYLKTNGLEDGVDSYQSFPMKLAYYQDYLKSVNKHKKNSTK